jgi:hypothetical protein
MNQPLSASGICESSEAPAAIGDRPPHVVAGEALKPLVQVADTRQLHGWNVKRWRGKGSSGVSGSLAATSTQSRNSVNDAFEGISLSRLATSVIVFLFTNQVVQPVR